MALLIKCMMSVAAEDGVAFGDTWEFVVCLRITNSFSPLSGKTLNDCGWYPNWKQ